MEAESAPSFCRRQDKPRMGLMVVGVAAPPRTSTWQETDTDKAGGFVRSQVEATAEPFAQGGHTTAHPETLSPSGRLAFHKG